MPKKLEKWIWFIIRLIPIIIMIFGFIVCSKNLQGTNTTITGNEFVNTWVYTLSDHMRFTPVYEPLTNIYNTISNTNIANTRLLQVILSYISYLVFVTMFHICYKVLIFLPEFVGNLFERKLEK